MGWRQRGVWGGINNPRVFVSSWPSQTYQVQRCVVEFLTLKTSTKTKGEHHKSANLGDHFSKLLTCLITTPRAQSGSWLTPLVSVDGTGGRIDFQGVYWDGRRNPDGTRDAAPPMAEGSKQTPRTVENLWQRRRWRCRTWAQIKDLLQILTPVACVFTLGPAGTKTSVMWNTPHP